ncbi:MAG: endonuclease/exonuclease/phosphatase family protein [bacterium]|nr:endonuclease/exonuclease/phosphatase family protein [bacterium]
MNRFFIYIILVTITYADTQKRTNMNKKKIFYIIIALILVVNCSCSGTGKARKKISRARGPKELKIATYNVHFFAAGAPGVRNTIRKIKPDIIGLQEVLVNSKGYDYSKGLARSLGYYRVSSAPYVSFRRSKTKWVLSFLSRYPVIKKDEKRLGKYRRALRVYVKINNKKVAFVTVHLSPFVWKSKSVISANIKRAKMRRQEIVDLVDWIDSPDCPTVVLGDFNILPDMDDKLIMLRNGYFDADSNFFESRKGTFPLKKSAVRKLKSAFPDFLVPEVLTLDYIFTKGAVSTISTRVVPSRASDHYPLIARVKIK